MSARFLQRHIVFALLLMLATGCAGTRQVVSQPVPATPPAASEEGGMGSEEDTGVRVLSLRLSAADYMLDLRFQVTDPARAAPFFNRNSEVQLIDHASGARLLVPNTPKLGKLRQVARNDKLERSYFMLFANPGRLLKAGSEVSLLVGDSRINHLRIE